MSEGETRHTCTILAAEAVTHDVRRFVIEKPEGYRYEPGQATEVSVAEPEWEDEGRPFTFTSLNTDANLELTAKIYPEHDGVTKRMGELVVGDKLIVRDPWGAITYRGPGVFIAGGAGVTPFIAILRQLVADGGLAGNTLIFSNPTSQDIILEGELRRMLGDRAVFTLTREEPTPGLGHVQGRIDEAMLREYVSDFDRPFYVCGPPEMVEELTGVLEELGADPQNVVIEA